MLISDRPVNGDDDDDDSDADDEMTDESTRHKKRVAHHNSSSEDLVMQVKCVFYTFINISNSRQEVQLPLRNSASRMHFVVPGYYAQANRNLRNRNLRPLNTHF